MSYQIVYGNKSRKKSNLIRTQVIICIFLLLLALCVRVSWPEGSEMLQNVLISDQLSHDAEAFIQFVEQIWAGEDLAEAVGLFCQEIIYGS